MKYLKYFESELSDIRSEYKYSKKSSPEYLPGVNGGTIDPEDDEPWERGDIIESDKKTYEKFLIAAKKVFFKETHDEIIIDLENLDGTFCISVSNYPKHIVKFLNDELAGKYIVDGFIDFWDTSETPFPDMSTGGDDVNLEGIIDEIYIEHADTFNCNSIYNIRLKDKDTNSNHTLCRNKLKIDKLKSEVNKYNL